MISEDSGDCGNYEYYENNSGSKSGNLLAESQDVSELVEMIKLLDSINTPTELMSDAEIRRVCRLIGRSAPDTIIYKPEKNDTEEELTFGRIGYQAMLSIALLEFPDYFDEHNLMAVFRN